MPKNTIVVSKLAKNMQMGPRNRSQIDRNPSLDPQGLLQCAPKSPCIARWSPRCQIGFDKHAKWHVLGTKFGSSSVAYYILLHLTTSYYIYNDIAHDVSCVALTTNNFSTANEANKASYTATMSLQLTFFLTTGLGDFSTTTT